MTLNDPLESDIVDGVRYAADANAPTFSPSGDLLPTEQAYDAGNDGLVILEDGTRDDRQLPLSATTRSRSLEEGPSP